MWRRNLVCVAVCVGTLVFVGYRMPNRGVFTFVIAMCLLYGVTVAFSDWGIRSFQKMRKKIYHGGELTVGEKKKLFGYSLAVLCPMYYCILIVSAIPLFSYEVWYVTIFPILVITGMPFSAVLDEFSAITGKKACFILVNIGITVICTVIVQVVVRTAILFRLT